MLCVCVPVIQPAYWIAQSCFAEYATDSQRATHAACVCVSCEGPSALTQRPNDAYDPCESHTTYRQNRNHTAFGLGIKTKHQHSDITYARCERGGKVGRWSRIARSNTTRSICVCVLLLLPAYGTGSCRKRVLLLLLRSSSLYAYARALCMLVWLCWIAVYRRIASLLLNVVHVDGAVCFVKSVGPNCFNATDVCVFCVRFQCFAVFFFNKISKIQRTKNV